jgi:uncharacterized secreted protein with C-terminal beta-propeller domain
MSGTTVTAVRSYSFNGSLVATRMSAGVEYLVTNERGSVELAAQRWCPQRGPFV